MEATINAEDARILITADDFDGIVKLRMLSKKTKQILEENGVKTIADFRNMEFKFMEDLHLPVDEFDRVKAVQEFLMVNS